MALSCRGCGNERAHRLSVRRAGTGFADFCDRCGAWGPGAGVPDVYWPGHAYKSDNITDANGDPILLTSRRHKADVMRQQNLSEAGDRYHGGRMEILSAMIPKKESNPKADVRAAISRAVETLKRKYRP